MNSLHIRKITPDDSEWPTGLYDLGSDMPLQLWVRGGSHLSLGGCVARSVAIVGSRAATSYGMDVARDFATGMSNQGYAVVSGLAFGIDQAAHRGALVGPAPTVAVVACGVDRAYPVAHAPLAEAICGHGMVVSEYEPGTAAMRSRFLARNRLIAAMTQGSVIVESAVRSGSLNEVSHAKRLGRPVFGVPGPITSATSAGVHDLIRSGVATLTVSADDVIEGLS